MTANTHYTLTGRISLAVAGVLVIGLFLAGVLKRFDASVQDQMASLRERTVPSNIVIVEIDSYSLSQLPQWPWNRALYARVLDQLRSAQVNSVLIDVDFSAHSEPAADAALAEAINRLAQTTNVRLPTFVQPQSTMERQLNLRQPLPMFAENTELVSVNIQPGGEGLVRQVNPGFIADNKFYASAWNTIANQPTQPTYIDFSISPRSFEYMSFADLLVQPLRAGELRGKDVLLGSTSIELGDIVPVPVYKAVPGVVLHGLAIETLLRDGLYAMTPTAAVLLLLLMLVLATIVLARLNWYWGLLAVAGSLFGAVALNYLTTTQLRLMLPSFSIFMLWTCVYVATLIGQIDRSTLQNIWLRVNLLDRDQLLASIYSASNDSILCVNKKGFITSANSRCEDVFNCDAKQLIGRSLNEIMPVARNGMEELDATPIETSVVDASFRKVPIEVRVSSVKLGGELSYTLAMRNLTKRKEKEHALSYAASHDKLTGFFNRVRFFELADEAINSGAVCTLLKLDIDYFNEINEVHGHDFGDKVLQILSRRLVDLVDIRNPVGRIGKDDFAILIRNKNLSDVKILAEKILSVLNQPFHVDRKVIDIFCHVGISQAVDSRANIDELIRLGNIALQTAKSKGVEYDYCESTMVYVEPQRLKIIGAIRSSLQKDDFDLAFQPKVSLDNGKTVGCEVLLRTPAGWNLDVPIYKLIEVAETTRLIADLTLNVVNKVLALEKDWRALNLPRDISLNLSLGLLANDQFIATLLQTLERNAGFFRFEFEITETSLANNWQQSIQNIDRLLSRDITLAIDDFGTGYSSLAYLRDLRAKVLKIDKSFVSNIHLKLENQSIVHSTIKMAHELGMRVVAEGIEQQAEKDFLMSSGCDQGQGYLFGRPMHFHQFTSWVNRYVSSNNVVPLPRNKGNLER